MSRPRTPPSEQVDVQVAADLLGVTTQRIYQLIDAGDLAVLKKGPATRAEFDKLPLLSPAVLRDQHRIYDDTLRAARTTVPGAVRQKGERKIRKYSFNDLKELLRLQEKRQRTDSHIRPDPGVEASFSGYEVKAVPYDFLAVRTEYRDNGLMPEDLPIWFWEQPTLPEFRPPTGVFQYYSGGSSSGSDGPRTYVYRTAGWSIRDGKLVEERSGQHNDRRPGRTGQTVPGEFEPGELLPQYREENEKYEAAEASWQACYQRAQRRLRSG